ncbi:MAG: three-Cys-motif partner protein TcmP [Candidatus Omnitrophica bacterium]|nr:three-Cys-motif partner protein TcmP [Candidatus Omnitrophota bacterium]
MKGCQQFGGVWTEKKLKCLKKYLCAYTTALKNKPFELVYIDAFAGTGYRTQNPDPNEFNDLLPGFSDVEVQEFLKGSARIALEIEPQFDHYYFIEQNKKHFEELTKLRNSFPRLSNRINLINEDSNNYLIEICTNWNWKKRRAILFLDPYGMNVNWTTVESIAKTEAIDMWYLFPLGVAVNRLLKKDGEICDAWKTKLDTIFGTSNWYTAFYKNEEQESLFEDDPHVQKTATYIKIKNFFLKRLQEEFADVSSNPLVLLNSRGCPLYLFCFAASNKKGAPIAIRIAKNILDHMGKDGPQLQN